MVEAGEAEDPRWRHKSWIAPSILHFLKFKDLPKINSLDGIRHVEHIVEVEESSRNVEENEETNNTD